MKRVLFVWAIIVVFLVSCSTGPSIQRQSLPQLPRSSSPTTPKELEKIVHVSTVGEAEVDLGTNQLILTTFRKGRGGMRVKLFGNYTRVPLVDFVHDVVKVTLEDFTIYVLTIGNDDKLGMVTFQLKGGKLFIR